MSESADREAYFRTSKIHRHVAAWPPRYVVYRTDAGWNQCDLCGREHRIWMTTDAIWRQLPPHKWHRRLCVTCFNRDPYTSEKRQQK